MSYYARRTRECTCGANCASVKPLQRVDAPCSHEFMAQIPESGPAGCMWCLDCQKTDINIADEKADEAAEIDPNYEAWLSSLGS